MENYQRQQSLWDLIKEYVPDSELPEVRTVLGEGLIDMYTEIYSEVQMWKQIWQDVQGVRPQIPRTPLADPPAVKDLLRAELQLLLLTLREKAARLGRDEAEIMSQYNRRVVSYALGDSGRNGSPDSQHKTATSCSRPESSLSRCESRTSSRSSSRSGCEDEIAVLRHKLNVTHIDEVVSHLKSFLTDECEALKRDVQFLQESVELEYQKQREPELVEPTLTELKEERRVIQRDLHVQSLMSEAPDKLKPSCCPVPSRFTDLPATDSEMASRSPSPVPPRMNCLYPNPSPPDISRPVHSNKPRHRPSLKVIQPLPSFPASGQPQELDLHPSCTNLSHRTSTASTTDDHPLQSSDAAPSANIWRTSSCSSEPREEAAPRSSPAAGSDQEQLCGSSVAGTSFRFKQLGLRVKTARTVALLPTPPAVQKATSKGQRASRRLAIPQTGSLLSSS
ncbi:coiled-coil domain-containing protein 24 [Salminus brasiliensis]|uniref:coiled-coil domain-containing protein 24 n=1 Tax=Salminus brasiliensis TaxID=930266 RepID=UPI003B833BC6